MAKEYQLFSCPITLGQTWALVNIYKTLKEARQFAAVKQAQSHCLTKIVEIEVIKDE